MVESDKVTVTSDTQPIKKLEHRQDKPADNSWSMYCPNCSSMLWSNLSSLGDGLVFLRAGTLENNEKIVPDAHFFVRSKHPWIVIPEGVRTYQTMPGEDDDDTMKGEAAVRFQAALRVGKS